MQLKNEQLKVKVEVGLKFEITFLTQHLSLSIFYPNLGSNNPALFRVLPLFYVKCNAYFNSCLSISMLNMMNDSKYI